MKMTLARALKEKKRLAGKIVEFEKRIHGENVFFKENNVYPMFAKSKVDIKGDWDKYIKSLNKMAYLKNLIAKANAENGISFLVYQMEEKKSFLAFLKRLNVNASPEKEYVGDKIVFLEREAQLSRDYVDALKEEAQKEIEKLQDRIDELNAAVTIDFDLELN